MAKDNLFLGMARGKVGDIVFYRQDGKQITRTRNRSPRNPRSQKQLVQRAIMATVGLAYKFGSSIFDHAFQGKSVGAQCQREFLSENTRILRGLLSAEFEGGVANPQARVVAPKSIAPVPFGGMMISRGTYDQALFKWTDGVGVNLTAAAMPSTLDSEETGASYASRVGLIPNDLYTFVIFPITSSSPIFQVQGYSGWSGTQYPAGFNFVRLRVRDLSEVDTPADDLTYNDIFVIEATNVNTAALKDNHPGDDVDMQTLFSVGYDNLGAFGIIRSRDDQDLRSTSYLHLAGNQNAFGITAPLVVTAWQQGSAEVVGSSLILEGGSLNGSISPSPGITAISFAEQQNNNAEVATYGKYIIVATMTNNTKKIVASIAQDSGRGKAYLCLYSFSQSPSQHGTDNGVLYQAASEEFSYSDYTEYGDLSQITTLQEFMDFITAIPDGETYFSAWAEGMGASGWMEAESAVAQVNSQGGSQYRIAQ